MLPSFYPHWLRQVDEMLPITLMDTLDMVMMCIGAVVLSILAVPWMILPVLPLCALLVRIRQYFLQSCRDLKRLEVGGGWGEAGGTTTPL